MEQTARAAGFSEEVMPKIGIIYGMENTFPNALVDRINSKNDPGVTAEHIQYRRY